ncbi:hexokinase [Volvox carteri f. nagariensis]|uniref:Phosphotransferase n=1 Tax=Volvox carteri f. nagariensis TaxID=3068 RepID=D8UD50_VOLCA|nr:hexokinase [Volvox carteri f. nagariensis]EFJ42371.1 hexokinase [Volvox carteri f. nagariensis]|eukprot:XP_002956604.1 hexokinase [Volvox carteri f. nagariensis]
MRLAFALPVIGTSALAVALALRKVELPLPTEDEEKVDLLLKRYREQLLASPERLAEVEAEFLAQMRDGLSKRVVVDGKRMMMLPTFVTRLPDGTETGECYALDLGGTNFRVMHVRLGPGKGEVAACNVEEVTLPKEIYTGAGDKLFDYLATTLKSFIDRHSIPPSASQPQPTLPVLGFCFSFAVEQDGLDSGRLLAWTKGFSCSGVVGNDPVALLSAALERVGRPCRVAALLNDTVGVLAAQRYLDSDTEVGVIIGTGTNACYVERLAALTKWEPPPGAVAAAAAAAGGAGLDGRTAINMEWGAFFSPQLPRCMEDLQVDAASPHPGKYLFEKLLSGMFLGEAARRILFTIAKEASSGNVAVAAAAAMIPGPLATPGSLSSATLSAIVHDRSWGLRTTRRMLVSELGMHQPSARAAEVVKEVCTLVARRSAQLTAMAVLAILRHNGWAAASPPRPVTVAIDGGVYERFTAYRTMLTEAVSEQLGKRSSELFPLIKFVLSHDGSALGAAVLAAAAAVTATQ